MRQTFQMLILIPQNGKLINTGGRINKMVKRNITMLILLLTVTFLLIFPVSAHAKTNDSKCWKITQYGRTTNQRMFYTITDNKNRLIIIDGGYKANADEVRKIIKKHKNNVYAWIITHPHPDHVGAFNQIMKSDKKHQIKIERIYSVKYNYNRYRETAQAYDDFEACTAFDKILKKQKKVNYLSEGDTFKLLGLDIKVFSAWNENTDKFNSHLCNLGSLMFKVSGKNKSMLFCADTQSEIEDSIIKKYGSELKADYVQCGHHGNWGLTTKFYDVVSPKVAFMDAPDKIANNNNGIYDGYILFNYFKQKGIQIYYFNKKSHTVKIF